MMLYNNIKGRSKRRILAYFSKLQLFATVPSHQPEASFTLPPPPPNELAKKIEKLF